MLLIDAISAVTGQQIAVADNNFVYLASLKKVEKKHITAAQSMVDELELEEAKNSMRAHRDFALERTDFMLMRDAEEKQLGVDTSLSAGDIEALLLYRQDLRDLPQQPNFPDVALPDCPIEVK